MKTLAELLKDLERRRDQLDDEPPDHWAPDFVLGRKAECEHVMAMIRVEMARYGVEAR